MLLGCKQSSWRSVIIPRILPKPDVIALTGGYRKTPILQIGADIYCDTTRIAQQLDTIAPSPGLFPPDQAATAARLAQWGDTTLFQIAVTMMFQPSMLPQMFDGSPEEMQAFIQDRMAMRQGATVRRVPYGEAKANLTRLCRELEQQLGDGRAYLLGGQPTIADFAVYHPFWFMRRAIEPLLQTHVRTTAWIDRIASFGYGTPKELNSTEALEIAHDSMPAPIESRCDEEGLAPGDHVEVLPTDYGIDPSAGVLLACTDDEIAIRRSDSRAGEVVVHFPRWNYQVQKPT